ncbi:hypothetical protein CB0940_07205 [Cercospora beticola]|uniref:Uncharacterized protein n=1 Tax=Cercospora beticola TaxID=122368 RepID=A0A2G5H960_CERBT|nr:hypothetical protein CB0940_07205 [Cercospora beticola]PIA89070.1 hypothetical protein CB0940_07205 [Cercospora beticola]WPB03133.1 hypothetical protein RHO25_007770 [Cercospora beticola]
MQFLPILTALIGFTSTVVAYPTISSIKMPKTPTTLDPLDYNLTSIILPEPNINLNQPGDYDPEPRVIWVEFYDNGNCIFGKGRTGRIMSIQAWASGHWYCLQITWGGSMNFYGTLTAPDCEVWLHSPAETCNGPGPFSTSLRMTEEQCMIYGSSRNLNVMVRCPVPE